MGESGLVPGSLPKIRRVKIMVAATKKPKASAARQKYGHVSLPGRPRKYEDSAALIADVDEYLDWCEKNPIPVPGKDPARRPPTLAGMRAKLGLVESTWYEWKNTRPDLAEGINYANERCKGALLEGGLANIYNGRMSSTLLGLESKTQHKISIEGAPKVVKPGEDANEEEAAALWASQTSAEDEG